MQPSPVLPEPARAPLYLAVIHAADGVRLLAVAEDRAALTEQVAAYVRENASINLWPRDAAEVHALLRRGDAATAIQRYFDTCGTRWDQEWLTVTQTPVAVSPGSRPADLPRVPRRSGTSGTPPAPLTRLLLQAGRPGSGTRYFPGPGAAHQAPS